MNNQRNPDPYQRENPTGTTGLCMHSIGIIEINIYDRINNEWNLRSTVIDTTSNVNNCTSAIYTMLPPNTNDTISNVNDYYFADGSTAIESNAIVKKNTKGVVKTTYRWDL